MNLVDTTLRMSLVILVALGATVALARRSAALRHWVLTVGIACAAVTPLLQFALPSWDLGVAAISSAAPVEQQASSVTTTAVVQDAPPRDRHGADPSASSNARGRIASMPMVLMSVWLAGALMSVSMLAVGLWGLSRAARAARTVTAERLVSIASDIQKAIGLKRPVTLLQSSDPAFLVTWGAMRPTLILPADAPKWPDDRARVVMRHELAHIARGDWPAQMLAETLRAVFWFNPLLWIATRRLRDESERACDDAVLNAGVEPANYASHLLELARNASRHGASSALAMARSSSLEGRVSAMLNRHIPRHPLRQATRIVTLVTFIVVTVPVAIAQNRFWTFSGTVVDQTNRAVPDATMVLASGSTGAKYEVRTDRAGHFEFIGLPSGDYQLAVQKPGFKPVKDAVAVAGKDVTRAIHLQIGTVQETITVSVVRREAAPSGPEQQAKLDASRQRAQEIRRRASEKCGTGATGDDVGGQIVPPLKVIDVRPEVLRGVEGGGHRGCRHVGRADRHGRHGPRGDRRLVSTPRAGASGDRRGPAMGIQHDVPELHTGRGANAGDGQLRDAVNTGRGAKLQLRPPGSAPGATRQRI